MFEVTTLALAPPEHLRLFADHYLSLGAARVRIYLDRETPRPPAAPGVDYVACGDDFWRDRCGLRPVKIEDRQTAAYQHAYAAATQAWMLFVDIDEFLLTPPLEEVFAEAPADCESLIFPTLEAVFGPDDDPRTPYGASCLRRSYGRPWSSVLPPLIYGARGGMFTRGLLGHAMGKHALRTGLTDVQIDIHESKRDGAPLPGRRARGRGRQPAWLVHYDAIDGDHWREKWRRRQDSGDVGEVGRKRMLQYDAFVQARAAGTEEALFRSLYALSRSQRRALKMLGLARTNPLKETFDAERSRPRPAGGPRPA